MSCRHLADGACKLGRFGGRPSPGCCRKCADYSGPLRGAGDLVAVAIDIATIGQGKRLAGAGCRCEERRERLNSALPIGG